VALIADLNVKDLNRVIRAFSTFYHLSNITEEQFNHQRHKQMLNNGEFWDNLFEQTIGGFKQQGKSPTPCSIRCSNISCLVAILLAR
jgi:phosphoenolpyruvate carboxylase